MSSGYGCSERYCLFTRLPVLTCRVVYRAVSVSYTTLTQVPSITRSFDMAAPLVIYGKHIPNLVLIWDSGDEKKPEFRVQLEVELDTETARKVAENLWGQTSRTRAKLDDAKSLVLANVPGKASDMFKRIIGQAFDDQP